MFDRFFGKGKSKAAAQKAELRGDLAKAIELYVEAEAKDDAARVMILRGDSEPEPRQRLMYYTQACRTSMEGGDIRTEAKRKRATQVAADSDAPAAVGALRVFQQPARSP